MSQDTNSRFESEPHSAEGTVEPSAARIPSADDGADVAATVSEPTATEPTVPDPTAAAVEAVRAVEGDTPPVELVAVAEPSAPSVPVDARRRAADGGSGR